MPRTRLVDSTVDLKAGLGQVWKDLNFAAFSSFVDDAELTYIIPAIGMELYDALLGDGLDDAHAKVLTILQKAEANFAISAFVAFGAVQISDAGLTVISDAKYKPASDKKTYMLQKQSRASAYIALEFAINYLEANAESFSEYMASPAHAMNRSRYVNTTADFSTGFDLRGSCELFDSLKTCLGRIEENYIDPILGDTISAALRTAILDGTTTDMQKQLLQKITKAVAPLTIADAVPFRLLNIDPTGMITATIKHNIESVEETAEADIHRLQALMNKAQATGESGIGKLKTWLIQNAGSFPGLILPDPEAASKINQTGTCQSKIYYI